MLIGVDVSPAAKKNKTGVEWYCYHVANELAKLDTENQYRFYTKKPVAAEFEKFPSNFTEVVLPNWRFWTHTALALELMRHPVDVFVSPGHIVPWWHPKRTISTIHDAGFRHYKDNYTPYQFFHAHLNTFSSAHWSNPIIVPSDFVAKDIKEYYKLGHKTILTVPNGFDPQEFKNITSAEITGVKEKYGIKNPYFIFVGRMETRKNILRCLQAFFDLMENRGGRIHFVLIGSPAVGYEDIDSFIQSSKYADMVMRLGYVPSREKASLLAGAQGLVFPSLYEGFGIPILEGFAAGTPVLTSNITSCPEIAGDAALIVDPFDKNAVRQGMERLLDDKAYSQNLISKGYERLKLYGWEITAKAIHKIILGSI